MYFPYFRGRQYELLALKELADRNLITSSVVPVIEPVKLIPALSNSLTAFNNANLPIGLILNPNVGDLTEEAETINQLSEKIPADSFIIPSILLNESSNAVIQHLSQKGISKDNTLVILNNQDYLSIYQSIFQDVVPKYTLCPDEGAFRRYISQNRILLMNRFNKRSRNADYPPDELFSEDHLFYAYDHYSGFGDYSIVGDDYIESGFAPYAVAIHIVYFTPDDKLRIRHFVSESNDDISDVAGKFYEAVTKLFQWYQEGHQRQLTTGLQTLLNHYQNHTYPGLPTLKKLSIMHHLELMSKYLEGNLPT